MSGNDPSQKILGQRTNYCDSCIDLIKKITPLTAEEWKSFVDCRCLDSNNIQGGEK